MKRVRSRLKTFLKLCLRTVSIFVLISGLAISGNGLRILIPVSAAGSLNGNFENCENTLLKGWAWSSSKPNTSIQAHVWIRHLTTGTETGIPILANQYRHDLYVAGIGNGYHAFNYTMDWMPFKPGNYSVTAYAYDPADGSSSSIGSKSFTVNYPTGNFEECTSSYIEGWTYKPQCPNSSIPVHTYLRNTITNQTFVIFAVADVYRTDLYVNGIGNGVHGFYIPIDWNNYPQGRYEVQVHGFVAHTESSLLGTKYYDSRKDVTLVGMRDTNDLPSGKTFATWIDSATITSSANLGSTVNAFSGANNIAVRERIAQSAYFAIATHGWETGITCYTDATGYTEFTTSMVDNLPDGYYNNTRCVLLSACSTGQGGVGNSSNLVNRLRAKGVWTVIGFQDEIYHNISGNNILGEWGCQLFTRVFTKSLGNGKTVQQAIGNANDAVLAKDGWMCGLDTVAGDVNQVVAH